MKRKVLATFLTACMAVGMLAGCGGQGGTSSSDTSSDTAAEDTSGDEAAAEESSEGGSEGEVDVNEDGTVNNPEAVEVDENKL